MHVNDLPGSRLPYNIQAGEGQRFVFGTQLATVIARTEDTGDLMAGCLLTGAKGSTFPVHRHTHSHEAIFVMEGSASFVLGDESYLLSAGDYVNIPPGTAHGYTLLIHRTKLLSFTFGGNANDVYREIGTSYAGTVYRETASEPDWSCANGSVDIAFATDSTPTSSEYATKVGTAPGGLLPYVLAAGEGERMLAGDQLYTFLGDQRQSGGTFIAVLTEGPKGTPIPRHFHEKHTEVFFCLNGSLQMFAGDRDITLYPGDFLHVPPGTVHSFQLTGNDTRFIGFLTPGLFEPFFRYLCDPFEGHIYPLEPLPFRFDRVLQHMSELDLKLLGRPGGPPPPAGA